jgi:choline dehydrogenase-like flavoprotein
MGTDPSRSVLDGYGQVHDMPNTFIVGGSTFPGQGGVNPTLTMQALALRTAMHIAGTTLGGTKETHRII